MSLILIEMKKIEIFFRIPNDISMMVFFAKKGKMKKKFDVRLKYERKSQNSIAAKRNLSNNCSTLFSIQLNIFYS